MTSIIVNAMMFDTCFTLFAPASDSRISKISNSVKICRLRCKWYQEKSRLTVGNNPDISQSPLMLALTRAFTAFHLIEQAFRLRELGEDLSDGKPRCRV